MCRSELLECLLEATGHIEYGARVTMLAIEHGKHMVLMNAELDGTVGPLLKHKADRAGVKISGSDGDQPAVQLNLYRFVRTLGLNPLVCGNIKGMQDRYRNPTTQESFARQWARLHRWSPALPTGTKISSVELEVRICEMRKDYPRWGAHRIRAELTRAGVEAPAVSTIHQVLRRNGLGGHRASPAAQG